MRALLPALLLMACAPKVQRDRGLQPSRTTAEVLSTALEPRRHAVLVGIDDYVDPAFPDLRHAGHDADVLGETLANATGGGFDEVHVLTGTGTTRDGVLAALVQLRDAIRREDTVVVYFSGHGTRVRDGEAWRRFLLTRDSRPGDLEGTAIDLADLQAFFGTLTPARKALIVDACFSGDGKSVVRPEDRAERTGSPFLGALATLGPGEAHLFATSPGRPSREDDKLGHGVYTWYLLDALSWATGEADLDKDGVVTAYEAHDHARSRTIAHTGGAQVPEAAFRVVGEADVVLAGDPAKRAEADRSLVYLYPASDHALTGARVILDGRDRGGLPGTVALPPGRHHLLIRDADGEVVVDGSVRLGRGRSVRADDLVRVARGPRHTLGARTVFVSSTPFTSALGDGGAGVEIWGARRADRGPQRGLYGEWSLGAGAVRPTSGRPMAWASASAGYQGDIARWRLRLGWGVTTAWLPSSWPDGKPDGPIDLQEHPDALGWVFGATGPTAGVGWVVSDGWALTATARPHAAALDPQLDGSVQIVPLITTGVGLEASW